MKRLLTTLILICFAISVSAVERSKTIVYINGSKYFVHTVKTGDSLDGLAATYGVDEADILTHNPAAKSLREGDTLRIPVPATTTEQAPERKLRKSHEFHEVQKGETLYAISRMYEIPIPTIIEDNPSVDPVHLQIGQRILIRKKMIGLEDEAGSQASWEEYRNTLNSVTESGYRYHIVRKGETVYSLSQRYNITEEEFSAMNNGLKPNELRAGAMVKVPFESFSDRDKTEEADSVKVDSAAIGRDVPEVEFRALPSRERLKVAMLLPITSEKGTNENFVEYYQGFLIGLDSVKRRGYSVDLHLYDTGRDSVQIHDIITGEEFASMHLIVGPVYEKDLHPVVEFAEEHSIPVVSPLATLLHTDSDVVFQMAPDAAYKNEAVGDIFDNRRITLIYGSGTDKHFEQEVLEMIGDREYTTHTYKYAHPSARSSASNLTSLLNNSDDNIFVVMSSSEVEVDRILAGLSSANTGLVSRGIRTPNYTVLGNTRWNRHGNIDRSLFFTDRVIMISSYHAKRSNSTVRHFDSAYMRAFSSLPTRYSYRGYDAAVIFCPAMFGDIEYDMAGRRYMPLQTIYRFTQSDDKRTHVNRHWMRIGYNRDFTITAE